MYGQSESSGLGLFSADDLAKPKGDLFSDIEKFVNKVSSVVSEVGKGYKTAQAVQRGDARVQIVPTQQGVSSYVQSNPWVQYALIGGAGLLVYLLVSKRR